MGADFVEVVFEKIPMDEARNFNQKTSMTVSLEG